MSRRASGVKKPTRPIIRPWRPADRKQISALWTVLHPEQPTGRIDPREFKARNRLLVASAQGDVAGFVWVTRVQYHGAAVGYIEELVVSPGHQHQGIGSALVVAAKRWLRAQGPLEVVFVATDRPTSKFYRRLGFRRAHWLWTT